MPPSSIAIFKEDFRNHDLGIRIKKGCECSCTKLERRDEYTHQIMIQVYIPTDLKPITRRTKTNYQDKKRKYKLLWVPKSILRFEGEGD